MDKSFITGAKTDDYSVNSFKIFIYVKHIICFSFFFSTWKNYRPSVKIKVLKYNSVTIGKMTGSCMLSATITFFTAVKFSLLLG